MFHEPLPTEDEINHCLTQMLTDGIHQHSTAAEKYAKMRLTDFSFVLDQWRNESWAQAIGQTTLPKVAAALQSGKLLPEQGAKMATFLQKQAEQGQTIACLYLAYLHSKGLFVQQNLAKAADGAHQVAQKKDWRGTQFLAEMLNAVPESATEILGKQTTQIAQKWQQNHPHVSDNDLQAACKRFLSNPIVIKQTIRQILQAAAKQGSPTAEQRLRNLIVQGNISPSPPAKQYCQLEIWLDTQFPTTPPRELISSGDVEIFPSNTPFLPQIDSEPEWWQNPKIIMWTGVMLGLLVLMWLSVKFMKWCLDYFIVNFCKWENSQIAK